MRSSTQRRIMVSVVALMSVPAVSLALTVSSKDVVPADNASGQSLTTGNGIKTGHIQNGAVTPEKISYAGVIMVHKGAGSPGIQAAINTAAQSASATNRYLVKVLPGLYDETVTLAQYVDLEGSGIDTTTLTYTGGTSPLKSPVEGTVNVSKMTIKNPGLGYFDGGVRVTGSATAVLRDVKIVVGVSNVDTIGIYLDNTSSLHFYNSEIVTEAGSTGTTWGIWARYCNEAVIANSLINVTGVQSSGYALGVDLECSARNVVRNTRIEAGGEGPVTGVFIYNGEIDGTQITVKASTDTVGVWGAELMDTTIANSRVKVEHAIVGNSSWSCALCAEGGKVSVSNSSFFGSAAGATIMSQTDITNSAIVGGVKGIKVGGGTYRIGNSQISGPIDAGANDIRVNCIDGNFAPIQ